MEQRNTIVKCHANPSCLFNYNGVCNNYVITIGADGSCQEYVETDMIKTQNETTCHPDCIHFDMGDSMTGPVCLFNHPTPLKDFYEGMPCKYYYALHKKPLKGWISIKDDIANEQLREYFQIFSNKLTGRQ